MRRRFATLDVFTDKRFAGNPLAVVLEPEGLDTAGDAGDRARVQPVRDRVRVSAGRQARTAPRCASSRRRANCRSPGIRPSAPRCCSRRLDGGAGERDLRAGGEGRAGAVPRRSLRRRRAGAPRSTFRACPRRRRTCPMSPRWRRGSACRPPTWASTDLRPARWSAGNPFTFVPVRGLDAIGRITPRSRALRRGVRRRRSRGRLHLLPRDRPRPAIVPCAHVRAGHGRARGPGDRLGGRGIRRLSGGARRLCGRRRTWWGSSRATRWAAPSQIELTLKITGGKLTGAAIAGSAVVVMEGTLEA